MAPKIILDTASHNNPRNNYHGAAGYSLKNAGDYYN
jgi:hypothetical protein